MGTKNDSRTEAEDQCFFGLDAEAKTAKNGYPGGKTKEIETVREGKQYFSKYGVRITMHEKKNYFTSCDPHHDIYTCSYWHIFWHSI